ncbi:MAG: hypothetical protein ACREMP_05400 [Candidatus Tyrphobacter sp.]
MGGPGAKRLRQRGAALLDLVVGAAVALMIFGLLVCVLHSTVAAAASRHATMLARTQVVQTLQRMDAQAASSWSIFVPSTDLNGQSNSDGHEVDFTTQDATRRLYHWAYLYDTSAKTLTRYLLAAGSAPIAGAVAPGITGFTASAYPATAISDPSTPIYDPLFAAVTVTPVAYALPDGSIAGNAFVQVRISGAGTSQSDLLATSLAPTQFTVVVQYTPPPQ